MEFTVPLFSPPRLRLFAVTLVAAETAFLAFLSVYVIRRANPMGDGMELMAIGALLMFSYLPLTLPAAGLALGARLLPLAASLAGAAAIFDVVFWFQITAELGGR